MDSIGEKIRIQRLIKNYSQEYMSWELGISQAAYSNLESNKTKPSLPRIFEIAEVLEISPYLLMPKPKYGFGINQEFIWRTFVKLRKFWTSNLRAGLKSPPARHNGDYSDKQNILSK